MSSTFLSIIIPSFNGEKTLPTLLDSIFSGGIINFEVIVVDDASRDRTSSIVKNYKVRYERLKKNGGPAKARNHGAKIASGNVLLFLDNDVILDSGVLRRVVDFFESHQNRVAVTGSWSREQSGGFFPRYKALRDWSYWRHELYHKGDGYFFSTRIAAVRGDIFWKVGGFDEAYQKADVEDMEFSYRLEKIGKVYFDPGMKVFHRFDGILPTGKKYFRRSFFWTKLFLRRRKFDKAAATPNEALITISVNGSLLTLFVSPIFKVYTLTLFLLFFFFYLFLYRKFLGIAFKKEGIVFAIESVLVGFVLYPYIFIGSVLGLFSSIINREFS